MANKRKGQKLQGSGKKPRKKVGYAARPHEAQQLHLCSSRHQAVMPVAQSASNHVDI